MYGLLLHMMKKPFLQVSPQNRAGRPSSVPMQNGHRSVSRARSEASSMDKQPEVAPSKLPRPQAGRAGPARGLPNGRLSTMPMDEADDADYDVEDEGSPEHARKRLRNSGHDSASARAWFPAAQDSKIEKNGRASRPEQAYSNGRALKEDLPDRSESDEAEDLGASDEDPLPLQPQEAVRSVMRADTAVANGQAGNLRSRLGNSAGSQVASAAQRLISSQLRSEQDTQDAIKKAAKSGRGLFSAALTGLQR